MNPAGMEHGGPWQALPPSAAHPSALYKVTFFVSTWTEEAAPSSE